MAPQVSMTPQVSTMHRLESPIRSRVMEKYQDRDDILRDYRNIFTENCWSAPTAYRLNAADEKIDNDFKDALKYLSGTREELSLLASDPDEPIDIGAVRDLLYEARGVHDNVCFKISRHYQAKEEGLRLPQERQYATIENTWKTGGMHNFLMQHMISFRSKIEDNSSRLKKRCTRRLDALDKAMERVEKLALVTSSYSSLFQ